MKKLFISIICIVFLSSCTSNSTPALSKNTKTYETANFSLEYPMDWEIIDKTKFEINLPENIIVAFRSNIKNEVFTTSVSIAVDVFEKEVKAREFALSTLALARQNLVSFSEIELGEITIKSKESNYPGFFLEYEGKNNSQDSLIRFRQVFVSKGPAVYSITRASLPSEDESIVNNADIMLNSFTVK